MSNKIDWTGGKNPCSPYDVVEVSLRDGTVNKGYSWMFNWSAAGDDPGDIVSYKIKVRDTIDYNQSTGSVLSGH